MNTQEEIENHLLSQQSKYKEAVRWLYYGARGSGRTYLICDVAIEVSLGRKEPVIVSDHSHTYRSSINHMENILNNLLQERGLKGSIRKYSNYIILEVYAND